MRSGSKLLIQPGELRSEISLYSRAKSVNPGGFQVETLTLIGVDSARWVGVHGLEAWAASSVNAERAATVTIRYRADINETCVIKIDGDYYEITSIDDMQHRHEYLELKVRMIRSG